MVVLAVVVFVAVFAAVVVDGNAAVGMKVLAVMVVVEFVGMVVVVVLVVTDVGARETVELPLGASVKSRLASCPHPLCCLLPLVLTVKCD